MLSIPAKRSKVHPLPQHAAGEAQAQPKATAISSPTPDLQLMDVSQQIRASASIHKYLLSLDVIAVDTVLRFAFQ
jgi:hypothetical protein